MRTPAIRHLTVGDLDDALRLSSTAGWNQRLEDWRMLLTIAPAGGFCAAYDGHLVGTAIGIDYVAFGWIAMMLVEPAHRGQGIGARLLDAALGVLRADRPVRLDATPMGRPLYERHGFVEESTLTRYVAPGAGEPPASVQAHAGGVRAMLDSDLDEIAARDARLCGGARRAVLNWVLEQAPQYARVLEGDAGLQYCFGRDGRLFDQIGPVAAETPDAAFALVASVVPAAQGKPLVIDAFDRWPAFIAALGPLGFAGQRPLFRMCRNVGTPPEPPPPARHAPREYAILGPEFA
jgi:GNAT superfamily N-acetyltransferase